MSHRESQTEAGRGGALPAGESIGRAFERRVRLHPDRIAFQSVDASVSYGELNRRANGMAWALRGRAPEADQRVGLCMGPGIAQVAAMLGILKAGLTVVVLDALGPSEGARAILEDAAARWLVADPATAEAARGLMPPDCDLWIAGDSDGPTCDRDPDWTVSAEVPACLVFTSGTTGRPKGVIRLHRNFVWGAAVWAGDVGEADEAGDYRHCYVAGHHTGNGVSNLFRTLLLGGTVLRHDIREQGIDGLAAWMLGQRVTVFSVPASVFRQFVQGLPPSQRFPDVRLVRLGSEKVIRRDLEGFRRHFPEGCRFANAISSTETGNFAIHRLGHATVVEHDGVPIGHPPPQVDVRLVGDDGEDVGFDRPGEIVVRGPGVAAGYWRRPELTARAFRPAEDAVGGRCYHTGDLAIRRRDGCLVYVGRLDFRVKIRGLGVDLQGVEAVLGNHPDVHAAAVSVRDGDGSDPWLAAFVVAASGKVPDPAGLRRHLRRQLPEPAVPGVLVFIDALPLTSRGKVDRKALALLAVGRAPDESRYAAPRTPVEELLAQTLGSVLEVDRVGIHDDFFELGGDSLLATRIGVRLRDVLGVELGVGSLFEAPTVAELAVLCQGAAIGAGGHGMPALVPVPRDGCLPLSFAQERLWFLNRLQPDSRAYHVWRVLRLRGKLDGVALERALRETVRRHEALRTLCVDTDGVPRARVLGAGKEDGMGLHPLARCTATKG